MNIKDKIINRRIYDDQNLIIADTDNDSIEKTTTHGNEYKNAPEDHTEPIYNQETYNSTDFSQIEKEIKSNETDDSQKQLQSILRDKVKSEIHSITTFLFNKGKKISDKTILLIKSDQLEDLLLAHGDLCELIKPATPEAIKYLERCIGLKQYLFSPIPLVRNFIILALIAIASLLGSGLSPDVNAEILSKGILNNSGISLLKNLVFLCSGAGIGTVFFLLSKLTKEVKEATLSKSDTTYYWSMLIMGILSGLIMSEIIVINQESLSEDVEMNRLIFALLGGFSSEVVYSIMQAIMNKIRIALS